MAGTPAVEAIFAERDGSLLRIHYRLRHSDTRVVWKLLFCRLHLYWIGGPTACVCAYGHPWGCESRNGCGCLISSWPVRQSAENANGYWTCASIDILGGRNGLGMHQWNLGGYKHKS